MDESASTTDGLGSVDHDGTPGAEPLVESSPGTAAAAAGVEVVSAPTVIEKGLGTRSSICVRRGV